MVVSPKVKNLIEYFSRIVDITGLKADDGTNILKAKFEKLNFISDDTVLAKYLNSSSSSIRREKDCIIFPFGCNESQFAAVTAALSHKISVIEGPPGTGKTQTILNILANLVLQGQTVQVVSNNNSAIDNVLKKLAAPACGIDFIAAPLGRKERKEDFIQSQTGRYPDLTEWYNADCHRSEFLGALQNAYQKLQAIFRAKNELAKRRLSVQPSNVSRRISGMFPRKCFSSDGYTLQAPSFCG